MMFQKELLATRNYPAFTGIFGVESKRLFATEAQNKFEERADANGSKIDGKLDFEKLGLTANSSPAELETAKTRIFKAAEQTLIETYKQFGRLDNKDKTAYADISPRDQGRIDAFLKAAEERRVGLETAANNNTVDLYFQSFIQLFEQFNKVQKVNERGHGMLSGKENVSESALPDALKGKIHAKYAPNFDGVKDEDDKDGVKDKPMYIEKVWNTATGQFENLTCARGFKDVKPLTINKTPAFQILDGDGDVLTLFVGKDSSGKDQLEVRPGGFVDEKKTQNRESFNVLNNIQGTKTSRETAFAGLTASLGENLAKKAGTPWNLKEQAVITEKGAKSNEAPARPADIKKESEKQNPKKTPQELAELAFTTELSQPLKAEEIQKLIAAIRTNQPGPSSEVKKQQDAYENSIQTLVVQKIFGISGEKFDPNKIKQISYSGSDTQTMVIEFTDATPIQKLTLGGTSETGLQLATEQNHEITGSWIERNLKSITQKGPLTNFEQIKQALQSTENLLVEDIQLVPPPDAVKVESLPALETQKPQISNEKFSPKELAAKFPNTLFLGDSLTVGFAGQGKNNIDAKVGESITNMPQKLKNKLNQTFPIPDSIVLLGGTNNIKAPNAETVILENIQKMIGIAKEKGVKNIFIGTLPPLNGYERQVVQINEKIKTLSQTGIHIIDFHSQLADRDGDWNVPTDKSGIHPKDYSKMSQIVGESLKKITPTQAQKTTEGSRPTQVAETNGDTQTTETLKENTREKILDALGKLKTPQAQNKGLQDLRKAKILTANTTDSQTIYFFQQEKIATVSWNGGDVTSVQLEKTKTQNMEPIQLVPPQIPTPKPAAAEVPAAPASAPTPPVPEQAAKIETPPAVLQQASPEPKTAATPETQSLTDFQKVQNESNPEEKRKLVNQILASKKIQAQIPEGAIIEVKGDAINITFQPAKGDKESLMIGKGNFIRYQKGTNKPNPNIKDFSKTGFNKG